MVILYITSHFILLNCIGGELASSAVDRGFEPRSGQIKRL
jgi:hypothetical protein